jgi:hypothetical protein
LKDVLTHEDLAIGSYRFSVSRLIPQMTKVALQTHKKELMQETPNFAKTRFLYRLSRSDYEREWGKTYTKPGLGTRVLSVILKYFPKVGPFKGMGFDSPTAKTEDLYIKSINATVDQYRIYLNQVRTGALILPNRDLDDGKATAFFEYTLADEAYESLLEELSAQKFEDISPELRSNILEFYSSYSLPAQTATRPGTAQTIVTNLDKLRAVTPSMANGATQP